jgi:hypothetical protein
MRKQRLRMNQLASVDTTLSTVYGDSRDMPRPTYGAPPYITENKSFRRRASPESLKYIRWGARCRQVEWHLEGKRAICLRKHSSRYAEPPPEKATPDERDHPRTQAIEDPHCSQARYESRGVVKPNRRPTMIRRRSVQRSIRLFACSLIRAFYSDACKGNGRMAGRQVAKDGCRRQYTRPFGGRPSAIKRFLLRRMRTSRVGDHRSTPVVC